MKLLTTAASMSRILKVMDAEVLKGDVMPWGNVILEVGGISS